MEENSVVLFYFIEQWMCPMQYTHKKNVAAKCQIKYFFHISSFPADKFGIARTKSVTIA